LDVISGFAAHGELATLTYRVGVSDCPPEALHELRPEVA
jgi:hypothetical protein